MLVADRQGRILKPRIPLWGAGGGVGAGRVCGEAGICLGGGRVGPGCGEKGWVARQKRQR